MIKNIIISLVKMFKLENFFIQEFKKDLKVRLENKLSKIENMFSSLKNSKDIIDKIGGPKKSISSFLPSFDVVKNEFLAMEKIMESLKKEIEDEIDSIK